MSHCIAAGFRSLLISVIPKWTLADLLSALIMWCVTILRVKYFGVFLGKYNSEVYYCSFGLQLFLHWRRIKLLPVLVSSIWVSSGQPHFGSVLQ